MVEKLFVALNFEVCFSRRQRRGRGSKIKQGEYFPVYSNPVRSDSVALLTQKQEVTGYLSYFHHEKHDFFV